MSKVALITFHSALNYGAVLQTYATCRALIEMGYDVELVNVDINSRRGLIYNMMLALKRWRFESFRARYYPPQTKLYKTMDELRENPPVADYYMVGSDQTWNVEITQNMKEAFFLDFGDKYIPRIAFSVSFGGNNWILKNDESEHIKNCVKKFRSISVRETSGLSICKKEFHREVAITLDPTLLHERYDELTGSFEEKNNIVTYRIARNSKYDSFVVNLAKTMGKKILPLGSIRPIKGCKYTYPQRVENWIKAIGGAGLVVTDSFHGLAFSILYGRQFVVFVGNAGRIDRIKTLLHHLDLEDRLWTDTEYDVDQIIALANKKIDYVRVWERLALLRKESLVYLTNSLM